MTKNYSIIMAGFIFLLYMASCSKESLSLEGVEAGRGASVILGTVNSISMESDGSLKIDFQVVDSKSGQGGKSFIKGNSDSVYASKVFQNTFNQNTGDELKSKLKVGNSFIANVKQNTSNLRQEVYIIKF